MKIPFVARLAMDLMAAGLLLAGLAYYWLDNLAHELIGLAMFILLAAHIAFNRRWYASVLKGRYDTRRRVSVTVNLAFLAVMLVLLVTSLMISRSLFEFLALDGGVTARQIHLLAAYWAVAIVGVHLGLQWPVVMNALRNAMGIIADSAIRTALLRAMSIFIAVYGVQSSFQMALGSKLVMHVTMDMWDFGEATPLFFLNYMSIVGLYAVLTHYGLGYIRRGMRIRAGAPQKAAATQQEMPTLNVRRLCEEIK